MKEAEGGQRRQMREVGAGYLDNIWRFLREGSEAEADLFGGGVDCLETVRELEQLIRACEGNDGREWPDEQRRSILLGMIEAIQWRIKNGIIKEVLALTEENRGFRTSAEDLSRRVEGYAQTGWLRGVGEILAEYEEVRMMEFRP